MLPRILLESDFISCFKDAGLACIYLAVVERQTLNKEQYKNKITNCIESTEI